jgi:cation transport regulator ChaB
MMDNYKLETILTAIEEEVRSASIKHGKFNSVHEGYAVILEELDELWDEVKKKDKNRSKALMTSEAKQVAAMAVRFIYDLL